MTVAHDHLRAKLDRATKRVVQLQAQQALVEMRRKTQEQAKSRREQARRRFELGEAVAAAGLADWSKAELTGLLLRAKDQFGESEVTRKMLEAHGHSGMMAPSSNRIH